MRPWSDKDRPSPSGQRSMLSSSDSEKVAKYVFTALGKDGFRMELHTPDRMLSMAHGVDLRRVVPGARDDLQLARQRVSLDHQRMIPHHLERARHIAEDSLPIVRDTRRLAVHQIARTDDLASIRLADRLMSETNAEYRNRASPLPDCFDADARFGWRARAG